MKQSELDKAMKGLFHMKIDRKRDKKIPVPTKEDLQRKFTMELKSDGQPVIREVK